MIRDVRNRQCSQILSVLARGGWVPLPEITNCAAQYNARIFELRRLGFRIENRTRKVNGQRHSWFRLVSTVSDDRTRNFSTENTHGDPQAPATFPQFGDLQPEHYGVG